MNKRFIKDLIESAIIYVDELELMDFYTDLIENMVNNDVPILEEYLQIDEKFEAAFEASGHVLDDGEGESQYYNEFGC